MAYELKVDGMAEISEVLDKLDKQAPAVAAQGLYAGAGVMANGLQKAIQGIKTAPFKYAKNGEKRLPSPEEKEALLRASVGIAKFDKNGTEVDTSVGFNSAGYVNVQYTHMSRQARTNYKAVKFGNKNSVSSSSMYVLVKHGYAENGAQNQKPVGVIANAINSGTSFMKKQPFFRQAVKKLTPASTSKMSETISNAFEQYLKDMSKI